LTKSRKAIIAVISTLIVVLVVTMYIRNQQQEEGAQQLIDLRKFFYADSLGFGFRIVINDQTSWLSSFVLSRILVGTESFDPFYTDLVFVHSRAEAEAFPDNIVVAWPTAVGGLETVELLQEAVDMTEAELNERGYLRPAIALEQFGLAQPLTVEDLVDNWEKVQSLFRALTWRELSYIMLSAQSRMVYYRLEQDFID